MASTDADPYWSSGLSTASEDSLNRTTDHDGTTKGSFITSTGYTSSSEIPTTTNDYGAQEEGPPLGAIIGGVVGGVVVIVTITILLIILVKKRTEFQCFQKQVNQPPPIAPSISAVNLNEGRRVHHQTSCSSETALIASSTPILSILGIDSSTEGQPKPTDLHRKETTHGDHVKFTIDDEDEDQIYKNDVNIVIENEDGIMQHNCDISTHRMENQSPSSDFTITLPHKPTRDVTAVPQKSGERKDEVYEGIDKDTYDISEPLGDTYDINCQRTDNEIATNKNKPSQSQDSNMDIQASHTSETMETSPMKKTPTYANLPTSLSVPNEGGTSNKDDESRGIIMQTIESEELQKDHKRTSPTCLEVPTVQNGPYLHDRHLQSDNEIIHGDVKGLTVSAPTDPPYSNFERIREFQANRNS